MQTAIRVIFYSKLQILKFFHVPMSFLIDFVIFFLICENLILFFGIVQSCFQNALSAEFVELSQPGSRISSLPFSLSSGLSVTKRSAASTWQSKIATALAWTQNKEKGHITASLYIILVQISIFCQRKKLGKVSVGVSVTTTRHCLMFAVNDKEINTLWAEILHSPKYTLLCDIWPLLWNFPSVERRDGMDRYCNAVLVCVC